MRRCGVSRVPSEFTLWETTMTMMSTILFWVIVIGELVALVGVVRWPRVRGKGWLVAYLGLVFVTGIFWRLLDLLQQSAFADELRLHSSEFYEYLVPLNALTYLAATAFLIVFVFQTGAKVAAVMAPAFHPAPRV